MGMPWKKILKIASIVGPIAAAPFTGGASLALIGAGGGAASAALSGKGWKGALGGAALGGLTAGIGGGAGKGVLGAAKGAGALSKGLSVAQGLSPILGSMAQSRAQGRQAEAEQGQADDRIRTQMAELGARRAGFELEAPNKRAQQAAMGDFMQNYKSLGGRSQGQGFGQQAQEAGDKLGHLGVEQLGKDTFEVPGLSARPQANGLDKFLSIAGPVAAGAGALSGMNFGGGGGAPQPPPQGLSSGLLQGQPPLPEKDPYQNFNTQRFPRMY